MKDEKDEQNEGELRENKKRWHRSLYIILYMKSHQQNKVDQKMRVWGVKMQNKNESIYVQNNRWKFVWTRSLGWLEVLLKAAIVWHGT